VNRTTIGRFVALIVIAGLVLAPVLLSVGAAASAHSSVAMSSDTAMPSDMECCPNKASHVPDCGKDCPFMALCMGIGLQSDRVASFCVPLTLVSTMIPGIQRDLDGLAQAPPIRPPKT
jgi:hypothetical protein